MPSLILGPLLRFVSEDEAVFWMETDEPCEVEVLGTSERTFRVCGHHYALVIAGGLEPGSWHEYEVKLDGEVVWPKPGDDRPRSAFKTYPKERPLQMLFGSCRVAAHTFRIQVLAPKRKRDQHGVHAVSAAFSEFTERSP